MVTCRWLRVLRNWEDYKLTVEYTNMLLYILYIFSQAVFIFLLSSSFSFVYNTIWLNCCNFLFFTNYQCKCNNLNLHIREVVIHVMLTCLDINHILLFLIVIECN